MYYIFKILDTLLRKIGYCFYLDVDTTNNKYEVKNIYIKKI